MSPLANVLQDNVQNLCWWCVIFQVDLKVVQPVRKSKSLQQLEDVSTWTHDDEKFKIVQWYLDGSLNIVDDL